MQIYTGKTERTRNENGVLVQETILFQVDADERTLRAMARTAATNKAGKAVRGPFVVKVIGKLDMILVPV